jgi:hypothetical protein
MFTSPPCVGQAERNAVQGQQPSTKTSYHSSRHPFTDALQRAGAAADVTDALLGWTRGNMRERYGSGPWIMMLADVMQRAEYPGLDLSHLYDTPEGGPT